MSQSDMLSSPFDLASSGLTVDPLASASGTDNVVLFEIGDTSNAPSNLNLSLSAGDLFLGNIASPSDIDVFAIELTAGVTYEFGMSGLDGSGGTMPDPTLTLLNSSETPVFINNDGGQGRDSYFEFTATTTGTYYIIAEAADGATGTYKLSVEVDLPPSSLIAGTVEEMAAFLQTGYTGGTEYTFDTANSNVISVDISGLTAEGQQLALWAMDAWEMVVDLDFQVVTSGAMITVDDAFGFDFAYMPGTAPNLASVTEINIGTNFGTTLDSFGFQNVLTQFGTAIGLGRLGIYTGASVTGAATLSEDAVFSNDSWQQSVMSAFSQDDNQTVSATYGFATTAMMVDILAIQELYGAAGAGSATAGDTVYGLGSNLGNYLDEVFSELATGAPSNNVTGNPITFTIYDHSGIDLVDVSFLSASEAARLDLTAGAFSDFGDQIGIMGIALGTVIENAWAGAGNDSVTGNAADNTVVGNGGNDSLWGAGGNDSLYGNAGADTIMGGAGVDLLGGGSGNDEMYGGDDDDAVYTAGGNDTAYGGNGNDTLGGAAGDDSLLGQDGNDEMWGAIGHDHLHGGIGDDTLGAADGNDTLFGDDGHDQMWGADGTDSLVGGSGNDTMGAGIGNDFADGGFGHDQIFGGLGNDSLLGDFGNDTIFGAAGDDTIDGGVGNDEMYAGPGADEIVFSSGTDIVFFWSTADDVVDLSGAVGITDFTDLQNNHLTEVGGSAVITDELGNALTLSEITAASLAADDFIF